MSATSMRRSSFRLEPWRTSLSSSTSSFGDSQPATVSYTFGRSVVTLTVRKRRAPLWG